MLRFFKLSYFNVTNRCISDVLATSSRQITTHTRVHLEQQLNLIKKIDANAKIVKLPMGTELVTAPYVVKPHHLNTAPTWTRDILKNFSFREKVGLFRIIRAISPRISVCQTIGDMYCVKTQSELGIPKFYIDPKYLEVVEDYLSLSDILSKEELIEVKNAAESTETTNNFKF